MVLDPREYKGTNYTPCIATNFVANLSLTPMVPDQNGRPTVGGGFFDPVHCDVEIAEIAAAGLNSIRIVGSFYGWLVDRQAYLDSLKVLCRTCWQYGVSITYCLWNTTQWGIAAEGGGEFLFQALTQARFQLLDRTHQIREIMFVGGQSWRGNLNANPDANITQFVEPGPDSLFDVGMPGWDHNLVQRIEEYLEDICTFFAHDADGKEALGSFDLYNEPDVLWQPGGGFPPQPQRLWPFVDFIYFVHERVRRYAPNALCTIGWAALETRDAGSHNLLVAARGVEQDYFSFHSYAPPEHFGRVLADVRRYFPESRPVVCSEFWLSEQRGSLGALVQELRVAGYGGQMWGFLQHNAYFVDTNQNYAIVSDIDGVRIPEMFSRVRNGKRFSFSTANDQDLVAVQSW